MESYRRIVSDLRTRIEAGSFKAGDRLPSTRALARKWRVANATAARALAELARAGYVEVRPRSGHLVADGPSRASNELTRERIVAAAIRIADAEGLEALSIRGVAARLETPVMSLYRHVKSKDDLLTLMADTAFGEVSLPASRSGGWRKQLEDASRLEWAAMRRHPWLARVVYISRPMPTPRALAFVDWVMAALASTALDEASKLYVHVVLHGFIQGLAVNVEAEAKAVADSGKTDAEYMRTQGAIFRDIAESGRFPHFAKMTDGISETFTLDLDRLFEFGLSAMLDGFAIMIEERRRI